MSKVIYVSAGWHERRQARDYMYRLEQLGFEIAIDWTEPNDDEPNNEHDPCPKCGIRDGKGHIICPPNAHDADLPVDVRRKIASGEVAALQRSQVFWLLTPDYIDSTGSWWEFGYATAMFGHDAVYPLIVSGPKNGACIFTSYPGVLVFPTHIEAFEALADYIKVGKAIRVKP